MHAGRNGGHLTPVVFLDFASRLASSNGNATEAEKNYLLESRTVAEILRLIITRDWSEDVDLVSGGHIVLMVTPEEEEGVKKDWEEAKKAGLNLEGVAWIGKDEMHEVSLIVVRWQRSLGC